jgi:hypothetical protein
LQSLSNGLMYLLFSTGNFGKPHRHWNQRAWLQSRFRWQNPRDISKSWTPNQESRGWWVQ